jgi:hypothetical protein
MYEPAGMAPDKHVLSRHTLQSFVNPARQNSVVVHMQVHGIHPVCIYRSINTDNISSLIDFVFSRLEPRAATGIEQSQVLDMA